MLCFKPQVFSLYFISSFYSICILKLRKAKTTPTQEEDVHYDTKAGSISLFSEKTSPNSPQE